MREDHHNTPVQGVVPSGRWDGGYWKLHFVGLRLAATASAASVSMRGIDPARKRQGKRMPVQALSCRDRHINAGRKTSYGIP